MKFILTNELGRLAKWLRILGYDALYYDEPDKAKLVIISLREDRVILTRDSRMSRFSGVRMVHIESDFVEKQLEQVIKEMNLGADRSGVFTRCVDCNLLLEEAEKPEVKGKVPEYVYKTQKSFMRCPHCDKIFWQGTHWALAEKFLERIGK